MSNDDAGVTLIELLVCMLILTVISTALAFSFMAACKSITRSSNRMANTHDSQLAASFFAGDMQSAETISTSDTSCGGVTPLISFTWFGWDRSQNPPVEVKNVASYQVSSVGGERQLVRQFCHTTGASLSSPSTLVVAHNLNLTGGSSDPAVTCYKAAQLTTPNKTSCNSSVAPVEVAQLIATAKTPATDDGSYFTYVVSGSRRPT